MEYCFQHMVVWRVMIYKKDRRDIFEKYEKSMDYGKYANQFGTKTMISEQASAFYEERAKGGVGAVVVDIEDIKNFDLESVQKLAEKLHVYDCQLWIACVLDTTTIDFCKKLWSRWCAVGNGKNRTDSFGNAEK